MVFREPINFWLVWSLVFVLSILVVICCFYKYYDEPDAEAVR